MTRSEKGKGQGKGKGKGKIRGKGKVKDQNKKTQDSKEESSIRFDCEFTTPIRLLFRQKRERLGLAYSSLAQIFGVNWSTVRKWEIGRTRYSNIHLRPMIEDYLNGKLDDVLLRCQHEKLSKQSMPRHLTPKVANVLEKIENTYRLCVNYPDLCEQLRKSLDDLCVVMLKKLLDINKK